MSTATLSPASRADFEEPTVMDRLYRVSVEEFERMVQQGIIGDRVVLLEGLLVTKMTKYPPHVLAGRKALRVLSALVPEGSFVAKEDPVTTDRSVPEPDLAILRGRPEDYDERHALPGEIFLVIEVADSSLRVDLTVMKRIYAAAMIPFYWVVNIPDHRLEVFSDPTGEGEAATYRNHAILKPEDAVPLVVDGQEVARIAVRDLLP